MKLHIKEGYRADEEEAYRFADEARYYLKRGILDYGISVDRQLDTANFWDLFDERMTALGIQYSVEKTDTGHWDNSYALHIKPEQVIKMESTSTGKSYWKYNQFEDTLANGDYYDKYTIKRFKLIPCNTPEECYDGDIKRFSAWAVCESEYPYKEVYCTKDEAYNYLMDFLNNGRYEQIHNL